MLRFFNEIVLQSIVLTIITLAIGSVGFAQVMTSPSYQLQSDSVNVGGGFSTSTNFQQESTLGEIATGPSDSDNFGLRAGFQQMQEVFLSLSVSGDVDMQPDILGITGGTSNGSTTFTVVTDGPGGYRLSMSTLTDPALTSGIYNIADYDDGGTPDFNFDFANTEAVFGFSPEGVDIVTAFKDDGGSTCGVDTTDTALSCWSGFEHTTDVTIAEGSGSNQPSGATTTVNFRVGVGSSAGVIAGVYTATSTVTALPL